MANLWAQFSDEQLNAIRARAWPAEQEEIQLELDCRNRDPDYRRRTYAPKQKTNWE